jgi:hypothetical protein
LKSKGEYVRSQYKQIKADLLTITGNPEEKINYPGYWEKLNEVMQNKSGLQPIDYADASVFDAQFILDEELDRSVVNGSPVLVSSYSSSPAVDSTCSSAKTPSSYSSSPAVDSTCSSAKTQSSYSSSPAVDSTCSSAKTPFKKPPITDLLKQTEIKKQRAERSSKKQQKVKIDVGEGLALIAQSMQASNQPVVETRIESKLDGLTEAIGKQTDMMMAFMQQMMQK